MAMVSASTGAMNSVIAKLTELTALLADDDKRLINGVRIKKNMTILKDELAILKGLLEKMADKEELDPLVKGWMNQVREMTYDLEDSVDGTQLLAAASGDAKSRFMLRRIKRLRSIHQLARLLEEMKERILEASERRLRYKLDDPAGNQTKLRSSSSISSSHVPIDIDPRLLQLTPDAGSLVGIMDLVGIDDPRDKLIDYLTADGQKQLKVASILGFGGVGKTTLAMEVYRCLKGRFDCHAVVSTSSRPDLFMILRSILCQVRPDDEHGFTQYDDVQNLIEKLRDSLHDKRYLIIIDDLWDTSAWHVIRCAFPENGCGSRILVTTRIQHVAESCCYSREGVIFMRSLADYEARKLFFRRIFHSEDHCPPHLKEASADILQMCCGLPLAIITVSGLLATKSRQEEEWMRVRDCIGSIVGKRSVSVEGLRHILNLCYVDLPLHLRTCMLYMSIFPEDYIIERKQLIWRWMAEGFIVKEHGKSLEEVGDCYFSELINRGLIQPVGIHYNGRIEACQVHDMILDFIRWKSAEENFVIIYDDDRDCITGLQDKVRRLSIHSGHDWEGTSMTSAINYSHVRSLSIFMSNKEMPDLAIFRALRVLDLESNGGLERYLRNVGRLYLLRYLRLKTTSLNELPEQIAELKLLQTLDLTHAPIKRLSLSIIQLKQLIHLLVTDAKLPDGIGELQDLQELSHVVVESSNSASSLEELGRLTKLRALGLKWCISGTDADMKKCAYSLVSSLNKLAASSLQSLHIGSDPGCSLDFLLDSLSGPFYRLQEFQMTSGYYFPRIPEWMASLVSLTLLKINIDIVEEEVLRILGTLPSLLVLVLSAKKSACPEQGLVIRSRGFQCLKEFDFICDSFDMLMFEPGTMPALQKVQLELGAKGACVDDGFHCDIQHLASLKRLYVGIDCMGAKTGEVAAVEDAIKSAVNAHPNRPKLELQRWGKADIEEDMVEIPVHGEEEKGHNDEEDIDVVEEELKPTTES